MRRVVIPSVNWYLELAEAVKNAHPEMIIVVNSEAKKGLALIAAERMGKKDIKVEVVEVVKRESF